MTFSDPDRNIGHLALEPGMYVADIGAGVGPYITPLAREVGEVGKVIALDIQKELLTKIKRQAEREGRENVEVVWADLEEERGSTLSDNYLDALLVSNILFQVEDKEQFVREMARILKPGGRLLLIDWSDSYGGLGPQPLHIVKKEIAQELLNTHGLAVEREVPVGEHHYGLLATLS